MAVESSPRLSEPHYSQLKKICSNVQIRLVTLGYVLGKESSSLEFSEFANTLWGILARGTNAAPFTRELFKRITDIPDDVDPNPIDEPADPTFKAYFTGDRRLTRFAPKIARAAADPPEQRSQDDAAGRFPEVVECQVSAEAEMGELPKGLRADA